MDATDSQKVARILRAYMYLRRISEEHLSKLLNIDAQGIRAFLGGKKNALSERNLSRILDAMNISEAGCLSGSVTFFTFTLHANEQKKVQSAFECVLKSLCDGSERAQLFRIMPRKPEASKRGWFLERQYFAIRTLENRNDPRSPSRHRIIVFVDVPRYRSFDVTRFVSGAVDLSNKTIEVDMLYWRYLNNLNLTSSEFDDIVSGEHLECSWRDVQGVARQYGFTPTSLRRLIETEVSRSKEVESEMEHENTQTQEVAKTTPHVRLVAAHRTKSKQMTRESERQSSASVGR